MEQILLIWTILGLCNFALAQTPQLLPDWPYVTRTDRFHGSATPRIGSSGDLDALAIYFNNTTFDIRKFRRDGSQFQGWPFIADSVRFMTTAPLLPDTDHDGRPETLTSGFIGEFRNDFMYLLDDNGQLTPGFPIEFNADPRSLNVADFDNDNEYEIMRYTIIDDLIHCFDRFGSYEQGWPILLPSDVTGFTALGSGGAVGDLDLDGYNEYIIMGLYHIYAYRFDGLMQPGFPVTVQDSGTYCFTNGWAWPPTLADFDNDGFPEIIVSGDDWDTAIPPNWTSFVSLYEHNGAIKDGWPVYYPGQLIQQAPVPCDINGDNILELGFQGNEVYFIDSSGNPLPGWPRALIDTLGRQVGTSSDLIILDIDGDGESEIFADNGSLYLDSLGYDSTEYWGHGYIYGLDHTGQYLDGFPLRVRGDTFSRPPSFGYDYDTRRVYMAIYTTKYVPIVPFLDTAYLELYIFPDSTGPPDQWPMLSHDNLMTRNYNFVDRVTSVEDGDHEILPKSPILKQNYPNPFNLSTIIEFTLPRKEQVTLSVYDILGRKVVDIYDRVLEAGTHKHRLSLDVPSGVYLYRLKTGSTEITRKMALVK
jgi:hypothetical protein